MVMVEQEEVGRWWADHFKGLLNVGEKGELEIVAVGGKSWGL